MRRLGAILVAVSFAGILVGCASTDWESRYLEKEQEARALQEQYDSLNQELAERGASDEEAYQAYLRNKEELDLLSEEITSLKNAPPPASPRDEHLAELQAELERLRGRYGDLVRLTEEGNIEILLESDVTFASGSYVLTARGRQVLDQVARELKGEFAGNLVRVIGHTDADPIKKSPFKDNWELGAERALQVIRYFSKKHGIDGSRLVGVSRGQMEPVADNATKEGRARNRRVEIVVVIPNKQIVGKLPTQR